MAHTALYRKYRSESLDAVVGQRHITDTLQKALSNDQVAHAYLFTGPKGVGKTSVARILAHEILGLTYNPMDPDHIDIIELDAASNRRIDEIRELLDKVYVGPSIASKKIYIIDEVHMLTNEAFNALLKTLEEPPSHVVFIMATTELHKLPETVVSRTQRFGFHPIGHADIIDHLQIIAKQESISVADDALQLIAEHSEGSFRDAISLLEQCMFNAQEEVSVEHVHMVLGLTKTTVLEQLTELMTRGTAGDLLNALDEIYHQGVAPGQLAKQLVVHWRALLRKDSIDLSEHSLTFGIDTLLSTNFSSDAQLYLESALLRTRQAAQKNNTAPQQNESSHTAKATPEAKKQVAEKPVATTEKIVQKDSVDSKKVEKPSKQADTAPTTAAVPKVDPTVDGWNTVLEFLKTQNYSVYAALRLSDADIDNDTLHLYFKFPFHKKRFDSAAIRSALTTVVRNAFGENFSLETHVDAARHSKISKEKIDRVTTVLGGEVIEL